MIDYSKSYRELAGEFSKETSHNTLKGEQYQVAVMAKCTEEIAATVGTVSQAVGNFRRSVEEIGKKSDELSQRIFWLNVILAVATAVGAIATVVLAVQAFIK